MQKKRTSFLVLDARHASTLAAMAVVDDMDAQLRSRLLARLPSGPTRTIGKALLGLSVPAREREIADSIRRYMGKQ